MLDVSNFPEGYLDESVVCPVHKKEIFPRISHKTNQRYYLCDTIRKHSHFLDDPRMDDEADWGKRNNFINEPVMLREELA